MAQTLDQIMASLNPGYDPMRQSITTQQAALPAQFDAQKQGLQAQADQANQNILSQAQQRGLGFSGIPIGEQAKYNATTFMPAVAKLQGDQLTAQTNLSDQLNKLNLDQRTQATGILGQQQQQEQQQAQFAADLAEKQREFNATQVLENSKLALARQSAATGLSSLTGGGSAVAPQAQQPGNKTPMYGYNDGQNPSSGFYFRDASGNPITAAQYAKMTGANLVDIISKMAAAGDKTSQQIMLSRKNMISTGPDAFTYRPAWVLGGI